MAEPEDPDPIAAPSDTPARVETDDTPAPSAELTALPSTTTTVVAGAGDFPCPLSMLLPIEWNDVRYFTDETGTQRYDTKNSPLPLPHPNMEFHEEQPYRRSRLE